MKKLLFMNMTSKQAADYLSSLPDKDLREILFEVFKTKRPNPEEDSFNRNSFFLGTGSIDKAEEGQPQKWEEARIHAVAYIDREYYPDDKSNGPGEGFCQFGTCGNCGVAVRSNYKNGICPLCSSKVYMT